MTPFWGYKNIWWKQVCSWKLLTKLEWLVSISKFFLNDFVVIKRYSHCSTKVRAGFHKLKHTNQNNF